MATIPQALAIAVDHHRADRLPQAEDLYRRILAVDGGNADALHLLGLIERRRGNAVAAVDLIGRALAAVPAMADAQANLASALRDAGRTAAAAAAYRRAVALAPAEPAPYAGLGALLCGEGGPDRWNGAITVLSRALRLDPGRPGLFHDLGVALRQSERLGEAIACYRRAIELDPGFAAARMSLGNALLDEGCRAGALAAFRAGLALAPAGPELYYNRANALHAAGDLPGALAAYRRAARLGVHNGLVRAGMVLLQMERAGEAEMALCEALTHPGVDGSAAIDTLVSIMLASGRRAEARALFGAIADRPLGGVVYAGECRTALAVIDLAEGRPHDAAARLAPVRGDNCRLFTVRSIARMGATLADLGLRLARPANPDPGRPRVTSSTLATHGRFAHNVLEYVLLRLYAERFGYVLETPDWVGGWFFDLHDPVPSGPLSPLYFPRRIVNRLLDGTADRPPIPDCDVLSPLFLFEHKEAYRERVQSWLTPRPVWRPFLDPALERLRGRGTTVVAIHIRRGDFVQYNYPITETAWYVAWLRELWPTLDRPVLYLASDDLAGVRHDFAEFAPVALPDVADPWPGLEYLQDFHVLMHADVVGISAASGFSLLAARLNRTARLFAEPDTRTRRIRPFAPWTA